MGPSPDCSPAILVFFVPNMNPIARGNPLTKGVNPANESVTVVHQRATLDSAAWSVDLLVLSSLSEMAELLVILRVGFATLGSQSQSESGTKCQVSCETTRTAAVFWGRVPSRGIFWRVCGNHSDDKFKHDVPRSD